MPDQPMSDQPRELPASNDGLARFIGGTPGATNLFTLYDDTITRLLAGLGQ